MEECKICYDIIDQNDFKDIKCGHKLCQKCYLNLLICECPFCRTKIFYNHEDIKKRQQMGIESNPNFSDNIVFNPNDFAFNNNNNRTNLSSITYRESASGVRENSDNPNYILSRNNRRRHRRLLQEYNAVTNTHEEANERRRKRSKRRRKLSDEEIKEKRALINKRKQMSKMKKHGRLMKEVAWYNLQID